MQKLKINLSSMSLEVHNNNLYLDKEDNEIYGEIEFQVDFSDVQAEIKDAIDNDCELMRGYELEFVGSYKESVDIALGGLENVYIEFFCEDFYIDGINEIFILKGYIEFI